MSPRNETERTSGAAGGGHPSGDQRFRLVDRAMQHFDSRPDALIEVLHTAQEAFGFLSEDLLVYVSRQLRVPLSRVYGVATFYHLFSFRPLGEHSCTVCLGTACYVKRAAEILTAIEARFGLEPGHTTGDGRLSLATARCLGSCGLAPVLVLDGDVVGRATPDSAVSSLEALLEAAASGQHPTVERMTIERRVVATEAEP
jgi:bidirectional [NiFe] hydrogenase diaphorase subunit